MQPTPSNRWARRAIAAFLVLHGVAHLVDTTDAVQQAREGGMLEHLGGAWAVGDATLYLLGSLWAIAALGFVLAAALLWLRAESWWSAGLGATVGSLALTVVALPAAWIGLIVNAVLLAGLSTLPHRELCAPCMRWTKIPSRNVPPSICPSIRLLTRERAALRGEATIALARP